MMLIIKIHAAGLQKMDWKVICQFPVPCGHSSRLLLSVRQNLNAIPVINCQQNLCFFIRKNRAIMAAGCPASHQITNRESVFKRGMIDSRLPQLPCQPGGSLPEYRGEIVHHYRTLKRPHRGS